MDGIVHGCKAKEDADGAEEGGERRGEQASVAEPGRANPSAEPSRGQSDGWPRHARAEVGWAVRLGESGPPRPLAAVGSGLGFIDAALASAGKEENADPREEDKTNEKRPEVCRASSGLTRQASTRLWIVWVQRGEGSESQSRRKSSEDGEPCQGSDEEMASNGRHRRTTAPSR